MPERLSKSELAGYIVAAVLLIGYVVLLCGCELKPSEAPVSSETTELTIPPGAIYETEKTREVSGGSRVTMTTGSSQSTGLSTDSDEVAGNYTSESPTSSLDGAGGGGVSFDLKLANSRVKLNWFHMLGGVMIIGSVAAFFLLKGTKAPSVILMACGVTSLVIGSALGGSVIAYVVILVVIAAIVGWYIWTAMNGEQTFKALQAVTSGVDKAGVREQVGTFVKAAAGSDLKVVDKKIEQAKAKTKG